MRGFKITLAESVHLDIKTRLDHNVNFYDIYTEGKLLGSVYPVISDATGIAWKTNDHIDGHLLALIGRMIESFEA